MITNFIGSKIAAGLLAGAVIVVGGAGAAAYANVLPTSLQETAHDLIGAPDPEVAPTDVESTETIPDETQAADTESDESATDDSPAIPTRVGPDVTGSAAYGLCQAYTHGGLGVSSTPYASFVSQVDGDANIAAYCADIPQPGNSADHRSVTPGTADTDENAEGAASAKKATQAAKKDARESSGEGGASNSNKPSSKGRP
jgi:hypothetical protein